MANKKKSEKLGNEFKKKNYFDNEYRNKMISSEELLSPKHKKREKELKKKTKRKTTESSRIHLGVQENMSTLAVTLNNHSFPDSKQTDLSGGGGLQIGEEDRGISHYRL